MASIGYRNIVFSIINEDGEYTGATKLARAVDSKVSLNIAEANLYADDGLAESAKVVTGGTIDLTIDEDDDTVFAPLLGHSISADKEVIKCTDDVAPYCGIGSIITKIVNNARKYKAEFLPKVQFKDSRPDAKTKGESIEFSTPAISGTLFPKIEKIGEEEKEVWTRTKTFDTLEGAVNYLDTLMAKTIE